MPAGGFFIFFFQLDTFFDILICLAKQDGGAS